MLILETERLNIRQFTLDDSTFILELLTDPDWLKYIGNRGVHTRDDARRYLVNGTLENYKRFGYGFYMVERKADGASMGMCGLMKRKELQDVDVGFAFLPPFRGWGYAYESADSVLNYARDALRLPRLAAITTPDNVRSTRLLEKLGFRFEKSVVWPDGDLLNQYLIEFTRTDSSDDPAAQFQRLPRLRAA